MGTVDLFDLNHGNSPYRVVGADVHPRYNKTAEFDVGRLTLERPLAFSDTVRPICLPEGTKVADKVTWEAATIAGREARSCVRGNRTQIYHKTVHISCVIKQAFQIYFDLSQAETYTWPAMRVDSPWFQSCRIRQSWQPEGELVGPGAPVRESHEIQQRVSIQLTQFINVKPFLVLLPSTRICDRKYDMTAKSAEDIAAINKSLRNGFTDSLLCAGTYFHQSP